MTRQDTHPRNGLSRPTSPPLFCCHFEAGACSVLDGLPDRGQIISDAPDSFFWVHVDLRHPQSLAWLTTLPAPDDIIRSVANPIHRGRLYPMTDLIYGQLRDLRPPSDTASHELRAGTLSILAMPGLVVTGLDRPLLAIDELTRRVQDNTMQVTSEICLLKDFFVALNDIGEQKLDEMTDRLALIERDVLRHRGTGSRPELLRMHREAVLLARDMAYKRTSMIDLLREVPPLASDGDHRALRDQVERYRAQIDDLQDYANRCHYLLDEQRAFIAEQTNRNLYVLTIFSALFLPATLIAGMFGMNVEWLPFGREAYGFWDIAGLMLFSLVSVLVALRLMRFF